MKMAFERYGPGAAEAEVAVIPAMDSDYVPGDMLASLTAVGMGEVDEVASPTPGRASPRARERPAPPWRSSAGHGRVAEHGVAPAHRWIRPRQLRLPGSDRATADGSLSGRRADHRSPPHPDLQRDDDDERRRLRERSTPRRSSPRPWARRAHAAHPAEARGEGRDLPVAGGTDPGATGADALDDVCKVGDAAGRCDRSDQRVGCLRLHSRRGRQGRDDRGEIGFDGRGALAPSQGFEPRVSWPTSD